MSVNIYDATQQELIPIGSAPLDELDTKLDADEFEEYVPFKFGIDGDTYGYYKEGSSTLTPFSEGGGGIKLADVSGATVTTNKTTATITWSDPSDIVIDNVTLATWAGTKVVRKTGSAPSSVSDGTVVVNSTTKNQYSSTGFEDTGLTYDTTYYYGFFPYTTDNITTKGTAISVVPARTIISTVPTQSGTVTYNGTEQTASFANFNSDELTVSGNTGTNAGSYTATFTPKSDYCWTGGSQSGEDVTWTISKATGTATLSTNTVTLDTDHLSATVTVSNATGTVSVSSSDTSIATASISGNEITILSPNEESGEATVTVSVAESSNYTQGSVSVAVSAEFLKIVTWAGGTDEEIAAMVAAADAGKIDLTEYWNVGDVRSVNLSAMSATGVGESHVAQTVQLALVAKDTGTANSTNPCYNYQYVTATSGRTYPSFIVQQVDGLANGTSGEFGYMNSSNTNSGSWNGCARRTWCNNVYRNAVPSTLRGIFKQVGVKTIETYNGSTLQTSNDYFFLPAEKEVFGSVSYSNSTEANALSVWPYYNTTANRVKKQGSSGSAGGWWERSPRASDAARFCGVGGGGGAGGSNASYMALLAPAGCI